MRQINAKVTVYVIIAIFIQVIHQSIKQRLFYAVYQYGKNIK